MTNHPFVLDVSAFQPGATYFSFWQKWKARGVRGAIVKLSESTYWRNAYGAGQIAAAKHEGLKVSGYHFARFRGNDAQARAEADFAIANANSMGLEHGSALVLDYEERLGYQSSNTLAAIVFCNTIKQAGFIPVFYSYSGMKDLWDFEAIHRETGAWMWIAAYPLRGAVTAPLYAYFPGISSFICAWQFSDDFYGEGVDASVDLTGVFTNMVEEKVTSGGNLDSVTFDSNKFNVSGWFASDKAQGKTNAYVILTNESQTKEYARQKVALTARPDVAKACPDIPNGGVSGFNTSFDYTEAMKGQKLHVIFRYTDDPAGNGNFVDYASVIDFTKSLAYLDSKDVVIYSNELSVSGWFASDYSLNLPKRFLILYDVDRKQELQRIAVQPVERADVQGANPNVYGTRMSGFTGRFKYGADLVGRKLQVIARYSDSDDGEGKRVDYWFDPFGGPAMPVLDGKSETEVLVHEFSATKAANDLISLKFK